MITPQAMEMELQVGVLDTCAAANEPRRLKLVRGAGSASPEKPFKANTCFAKKVPVLVQRDRLLGRELNIKLKMVL